MELRRDILWRTYLCFIGIIILCAAVLGRTFFIQRVQGAYWRNISDSLHQKIVDLGADRGTIYSEDGSMLSSSVPYFNIYVDFGADGLREKNGKRFKENVDSLAACLSALFKDKTTMEYKHALVAGFQQDDRYYALQKNISFDEYRQLRNFPLVRQGRNKSGFISETVSKRINPFGLLANRTIGLSRNDSKQNVGLERTYDTLLKGENGRRLVRYIASGTYIPIEGYEIDPVNGKDVMTTIDVNIQDIAESALLRQMQENECEHGTCIVMETATGKIRAMANLGRQPDGTYWEDLNYAIRASEPGSTFKLATLLSLLEDHAVSLTDHVNMEGGTWKIGKRTVHDSEHHDVSDVTVQHAFEESSNVAMAKLAVAHYSKNPQLFVDHLRKLKLNHITGIDLAGETDPIIKSPQSRSWSASTLPWMAFGYEVLISPLQTLMLYNAIANNGQMMKPYLVNSIQSAGLIDKQNQPVVSLDRVCSETTLQQLQTCLKGVCITGTAKSVFKDSYYPVAGKTGTALVANGNRGYSERIYQSSFAGYFPANHPKYSCIVVIKNKPFAKNYLGAKVAAPVFKELSDKLMSTDKEEALNGSRIARMIQLRKDSIQFMYAGYTPDMKNTLRTLDYPYTDSTVADKGWSKMYLKQYQPVLSNKPMDSKMVPDVKGMGLKDALYLLEQKDIHPIVKGMGKVRQQSISPGTAITNNQVITLELNP